MHSATYLHCFECDIYYQQSILTCHNKTTSGLRLCWTCNPLNWTHLQTSAIIPQVVYYWWRVTPSPNRHPLSPDSLGPTSEGAIHHHFPIPGSCVSYSTPCQIRLQVVRVHSNYVNYGDFANWRCPYDQTAARRQRLSNPRKQEAKSLLLWVHVLSCTAPHHSSNLEGVTYCLDDCIAWISTHRLIFKEVDYVSFLSAFHSQEKSWAFYSCMVSRNKVLLDESINIKSTFKNDKLWIGTNLVR